MTGIYKIENLINGKKYIGQSIHIERRWSEHCFPSNSSQISLAIKEFGKENFSFNVIEECLVEDLDKKEAYWINFYNSIIPNGYNVTENSETSHTNYYFKGKETIEGIINDLKNNLDLSLKAIAEKYNINVSNVSRINQGITHKQEKEIYPLRQTLTNTKKDKNFCIDCGKEISYGAHRCNQCEGFSRRVPLDKMPVTREELKSLIRNNSFVDVALKFKITDNAIRKWCIKFNLPIKKREINKYSDEEWLLV